MLKALQFLLALAAVALAGWSVIDHRADREARFELEMAFAQRAPDPRLLDNIDELRREPDTRRAEVLAARKLVFSVIDNGQAETQEELAILIAAVDQARKLAATVITERPADAHAAMVLGAATYLSWSLTQDRRLFTEAAAWEDPLNRAIELAPADPNAARVLATAYLEVWFALSPDKREIAEQLLKRELEDPQTFRRLIGRWLLTASDLDEALSMMPSEPAAWKHLSTILGRRSDWAGYIRTAEGWRDALEVDLNRRMSDAETVLEAGHFPGARAILLGIVLDAPVDGRFASHLDRVLGILPPGPVQPSVADRLEDWLHWALERCLVSTCPLQSSVIRRLEGLTSPEDLEVSARAALAAKDLVAAEAIERKAQDLFDERWAPYFIMKARHFLEMGSVSEARAALDRVHRSWRADPLLLREQLALARAQSDSGEVATIERRLQELSKERWDSYHWNRSGGRSQLTLHARADGRLRVEMSGAQGKEGVVAVSLDSDPPHITRFRSGSSLDFGLRVGRGLHLLEVRRIAGTDARPGAIVLGPE